MNSLDLAVLIIGIFDFAVALVWITKDNMVGALVLTLAGMFCILAAVL